MSISPKKPVKENSQASLLYWWAGMDSNHRTHMRTDLQSAAFSHSATYPLFIIALVRFHTKNMVLPQGFEPWTHRL